MKVKSEITFQFSTSASGDANLDQHDQQSLAKWALILGVTKEKLLQA